MTTKVIKTTDALNHATYTLYDRFERQIATFDATKHQTSATEYDAVDRVIAATDTFGKITTTSYATDNLHQTTTSPTGVILLTTFDTAGRTTTENEQVGTVIRTTQYDYDQRNRKTRITDAEGGVTRYEYYLDNQTKSVTDAALVPNITSYIYDYDNLNRVKAETWVGGSRVFTYTYDQNSNLLSANDGNIRYEYAYDQTDLVERIDRLRHATRMNINYVRSFCDTRSFR